MIMRSIGLIAVAALFASTQLAFASTSLSIDVVAPTSDSLVVLASKGGDHGGKGGSGHGSSGHGHSGKSGHGSKTGKGGKAGKRASGNDDGTPDQGSGCCETEGSRVGDDDGTPDQGRGDN